MIREIAHQRQVLRNGSGGRGGSAIHGVIVIFCVAFSGAEAWT